jgi:translation initiation factor eIF-2B subunit beta
MTIGYSKLILHFLKEAARFRKFQLILAENAPFYDGHQMAVELSKSGIETTVVTDSAVFAVMSRVNKVLLGGHAVTADGGLIALSGSHLVASAAKHHSTPVVVCASLYSMTASYLINDSDAYNLCISPEASYSFADST